MRTTESADPILDASALLALILVESGWERVRSAIAEGAVIGAANYAEVLTKLVDGGKTVDESKARVRAGTANAMRVESLIEADAVRAAELRPSSRRFGLSLGDRSCLAVSARLGAPVLTADRAWLEVPGLGVPITLIR